MSLLLEELNDGQKQELDRVRKANTRQETEIKKFKRELKKNKDVIDRKDHSIKALEVELRYNKLKISIKRYLMTFMHQCLMYKASNPMAHQRQADTCPVF